MSRSTQQVDDECVQEKRGLEQRKPLRMKMNRWPNVVVVERLSVRRAVHEVRRSTLDEMMMMMMATVKGNGKKLRYM